MSTYDRNLIEGSAHDARREIRGAISALRSAIESLEPYAELEYEEHAESGLAVNMTDLIGRVGRDNAASVEHIGRALRYVLRAVPDVEAMLTERMTERESVTITRLES